MFRLIAITIAIAAALSSLAMQGPDERPSLYIFCGPGPNGGPCGPCEAFHRDYNSLLDARLRNSLRDDFRAVSHYDVRTQPKLAASYNVDRWPTFLAVDGRGNVLRKVVGYDNAYKLWLDMTHKSQAQTPAEPIAPVSQSKLLPAPPAQTPDPATPDPATVPTAPTLDRPPLKPATSDETPAECVDGVCRVPVAGSSDGTSRLPAPDPASPKPATGALVADSSDTGSRTATKWLSVLKWGATTAITIAAPELAIPGAAGIAIIGVGLSWMRRRREHRRGFTATTATSPGPVAVIRDTEIRPSTTNHYVVKETDRKGEAYKEALRRTVAAYKSDKPGIVDVAGQIEHVAQEILRGQNVEHRAATTPRPGIWTDTEESH